DLASLRNTKNLVDLLKSQRPNDRAPLYCLNQVGIPKRPEIATAEHAKASEIPPAAAIPFDPQMFVVAGNNGHVIQEMSANHRHPRWKRGARTITIRSRRRSSAR